MYISITLWDVHKHTHTLISSVFTVHYCFSGTKIQEVKVTAAIRIMTFIVTY